MALLPSIQGTTSKIFRIRPGVDGSREQVTYGNWNDEDAALSPDGKRLYFTSDRDGGIYNIYSISLDTGETNLHTNVVGGCFSPAVLIGRDGTERLVFSAYYKRSFTLYVSDAKKPYRKLADLNPAPSPAGPASIAPFQPSIEVSIDPEKIQKKPSRKLILEDAQILAGVASDQTFLSNTFLVFGDNLGDRRFVASLQSVSSFTDFRFQYTDLSRRLQKGIQAFDSRYYFLAFNNSTGEVVGPAAPTDSREATSSCRTPSAASTGWKATSGSCRASTTATPSGSTPIRGPGSSTSRRRTTSRPSARRSSATRRSTSLSVRSRAVRSS